ncbi:STAS/SEC14 domain-containing protein [Shewanella sp. 1_MG-2023]|uniref:STAS/SEC14 domain-containing protein n=1 Tax=unclassified Shewanella TaxID=196818 RepID=UPI0026E2E47D|nr:MULTISPECIES: STAS/SEC14 domain-containing protein [unclassified Shewanella]MDO6612287.1 STAS/SEC14 domain-containing protein [Shewanella sp. 7_MG-2023]MDO6772141.1 STAS/SEC14 domain-containing protein [Shewanella sp. 2_MG-2023]MDO6794047.1 STAS/SEC14 domain-containing protein [Shewanella sp. 1_MG-2023]
MTQESHGFSIGIERINSDVFLSLKAKGTLTHQDYLTITPIIESALAEVNNPKVKVFIDGTELDGWEMRAAWDDLKLGLKHGNEFEKIAIYGNKGWQEVAGKIAKWFIHGESQFFEDKDKALQWLLN